MGDSRNLSHGTHPRLWNWPPLFAAQVIRAHAGSHDASRAAGEYHTVDVGAVEIVRRRSVAVEHVALAALDQVGLDAQLAALGFYDLSIEDLAEGLDRHNELERDGGESAETLEVGEGRGLVVLGVSGKASRKTWSVPEVSPGLGLGKQWLSAAFRREIGLS